MLATQNPIEQDGTYPLPEAQLDRFLSAHPRRLSGRRRRTAILAQTTSGADARIAPVMRGEDVIALQKLVRDATSAMTS